MTEPTLTSEHFAAHPITLETMRRTVAQLKKFQVAPVIVHGVPCYVIPESILTADFSRFDQKTEPIKP